MLWRDSPSGHFLDPPARVGSLSTISPRLNRGLLACHSILWFVRRVFVIEKCLLTTTFAAYNSVLTVHRPSYRNVWDKSVNFSGYLIVGGLVDPNLMCR